MNTPAPVCPACDAEITVGATTCAHCATPLPTARSEPAMAASGLTADQRKMLEIWRENRKTDAELQRHEAGKDWLKKHFS